MAQKKKEASESRKKTLAENKAKAASEVAARSGGGGGRETRTAGRGGVATSLAAKAQGKQKEEVVEKVEMEVDAEEGEEDLYFPLITEQPEAITGGKLKDYQLKGVQWLGMRVSLLLTRF